MPKTANRRRVLALVPGVVALIAGSPFLHGASAKRELALQYFQQAQQQRLDLESVPEADRTRENYQKVILAFRRVYTTSPQSSKADDSLLAVGDLYSEMSERFGPAPYRDKAIQAYRFLINEYPLSPLLEDARQKLQALETQAGGGRPAPTGVPHAVDASLASAGEAAGVRSGLRITDVRYFSFPELTRVVITLDADVDVHSERLTDPDRVYFDLPNTWLSPAWQGRSIHVGDHLVRRIRIAHTRVGVTRVVVDLNADAQYAISKLTNPARIVLELRRRDAGIKPFLAGADVERRHLESAPQDPLRKEGSAAQPAATKTQGPSAASAIRASEPARLAEVLHNTSRSPRSLDGRAADSGDASSPSPPKEAAKKEPAAVPSKTTVSNSGDFAESRRPRPGIDSPKPAGAVVAPIAAAAAGVPTPSPVALPAQSLAVPPALPAAPPESRPTVEQTPAAAVNSRAAPAKPAASPTLSKLAPPKPAQPTSSGERDLIRALGLKISRVVIDAGHGGHDTGTVGPTGLMEKDLTLDIATRLGALITERIGSEVIFTRTDDTFIPLQDRTALANEKGADLFISIHANSSRVRAVRGIETYYLNLTGDREALETAARENAASQKSIHELQDLVSKITLTEKISESREFASQVQRSLYSAVSRETGALRNRGVRTAPFVVLIGARMPSVLAEVSFLSNPRDEKLLKTGAYRQKIAEALYKGLASYAGTLSQVEVAKK
jgi:N-acetylmuramoyl-L-alanine amidase